jgi:maleate cis-trans isomerase
MAKFGCISPSIVQLPWDLTALLPHGVEASVVTLNVRGGLPGEHERALGSLHRATDVLIDNGSKAVVVFGIPVSARRGFAAERSALDALTADRGAVPIISSLAAAVLALRQLGVKHPLFITQYATDVNAAILTFCRDAGIEAAGAAGLGASTAAEVNALTPTDFAALARQALDRHQAADGIFLSARGNLFELARRLEAALNLPVIEQIEASLWWSLSRLNATARPGSSHLLSTAPARLL